MYSKIARKNVRKSVKDYTIYFLTLTFAVCLFYSFNSINDQSAMYEMSRSTKEYILLMQELLSGVSIFVSVILGGLIIYATNFLISRRKKEFGVYMTLGMSKGKISTILFLETFLIGVISLVVGLIVGCVASQGLSILAVKMFVVDMSEYRFIISSDAIVKTILYFGIMYLLVMLFNVVVVSRYKLIDLLSASKKSEKVKLRNPYVAGVIFIISMIILGVAYYLILEVGLNFYDSRFAVSIILGIVGTLLFFYGISSVIFTLLQKSKNQYLNGLNIFTTRQISSKFKTNFISMTIVCLMLFITIGIMCGGIGVKTSLEASIKQFTPFDATIQLAKYDKEAKVPTVEEVLKEVGYSLGEGKEYAILNGYNLPFSSKEILSKYADESIKSMMATDAWDETMAITISDFNKMREISGKEAIELKNDEILVACNMETIIPTVETLLKEEDSIEIRSKEYKFKGIEPVKDSFATTGMANTIFTFIVPDELVIGLEKQEPVININFVGENIEESIREINKLSEDLINERSINVEQKGYNIMVITKQGAYEQNMGLSTIILFIAMYVGVIFLLASAAVLAIQQLSQCNESIDRYKSLVRIGATKSMINKSILIQVVTFFMLPLSLAIIHSVVGIIVIKEYMSVLGVVDIVNTSIVIAIIMIIVYGGYFYSTYIGYKNIINND